MPDDRDRSATLRDDYERVALAGAKRHPDEARSASLTPALEAALERLVDAGLAAREGAAVTLHLPEYARVELDESSRAMMRQLHDYWLRADDETSDDEVLYGELGYWQHWWNMINARPDRDDHPLDVAVVIADDAGFAQRDWVGGFDHDIVEHIADRGLVTGKLIVPPSTLGAPAEALIDVAEELGLSVRVFPAPTPFVVYDGEAVALPDGHGDDGLERHLLTRRPSVVEPLRRLFNYQWAAAVPWATFLDGTSGILRLLGEGWTDARIADALGVSTRTVSRRIADAMSAAGVQSRFALGMKYALSELGRQTP